MGKVRRRGVGAAFVESFMLIVVVSESGWTTVEHASIPVYIPRTERVRALCDSVAACLWVH